MTDLKASYHLALDKLLKACNATTRYLSRIEPYFADFFRSYSKTSTIQKMKAGADKCWSLMGKLRINSLCTSCGAVNFRSFYSSRTLISAQICQDVLASCLPHFSAIRDLITASAPFTLPLGALGLTTAKIEISNINDDYVGVNQDKFINLFDTLVVAEHFKKSLQIEPASSSFVFQQLPCASPRYSG